MSLAGNSGKGTSAARAALPNPISVLSMFVCPNNGVAASVGIFTCTQMLMYAIAHGECGDTVRESEPIVG